MKKFLMVVGGAAVVVLFLIVALVAVMAIKGRGLDKESQHYADASIVAIVTNWNEGALMDRASPEFIKACPAQCTAQLFSNAGSLGPLQHYLGSKGQANMSFWVGKGTIITAAYIA